jgi:hypothetical protein
MAGKDKMVERFKHGNSINTETESTPEMEAEKFEDENITDGMVVAAAKLFSENYGVWGPLAEENMAGHVKKGE